jgi:hypothetical protein
MNAKATDVEREVEATEVKAGVLALISKAELDQQIATARAFPRSLKAFVNECMEMATLNEKVASECFYALPRSGKTIEGPSARLAEIVASAWGNCRAGARIVDEGADFITAQGVFHDLQRNVSITYEVRRRITDSKGKRYNADMIGVTGNAACSIALRNAVFKGVPKAFWNDIYESARRAAVGDVKTLANKRTDALAYLQKMGATADMVFATLGVKGAEDIGLDELATLKGLITAVKDGETTIELAFAPKETEAPKAKPATDAPAAVQKGEAPAQAAPKTAPPPNVVPVGEIQKLIDASGVLETDFLHKFRIDSIESLPLNRVNDALAYLRSINAR